MIIKSALIASIVFALSFTAFPAEAAAQRNGLCDPEWWRDSATASGVRTLAQAHNVDAVCPNTADYPIHLAVFFADDVGAVEALLQLGANMARSNSIGQTPATLVDIRLNAAVTLRLRTDVILGIEQLVNQGAEADNLAQNSLCSLTWWPSATRASVVAAIHQGADPNQDCDGFGNKPIHIAMDLTLMPYPLSSASVHAIGGGLLEDGGVVPDAKAVRMVEDRYTRTKIIYEEALREDLEGRISPAEFDRKTNWAAEVTLYTVIRHDAKVESYWNARDRTTVEMGGILDRVLIDYFGRPAPR